MRREELKLGMKVRFKESAVGVPDYFPGEGTVVRLPSSLEFGYVQVDRYQFCGGGGMELPGSYSAWNVAFSSIEHMEPVRSNVWKGERR